MMLNNSGLVSASKDELMAIWLFDDDMFGLFDYGKRNRIMGQEG